MIAPEGGSSAIEREPATPPTHRAAVADLATHCVAARDGEDTLDRCRARRMQLGTVAQPAANGSTGQGQGCQGEHASVGRVDLAGQRLQESDIAAQQIGLPGKDRHDVALRDDVEHREQLMAHTIPTKGWVPVGWVIHRVESDHGAQLDCLVAPQAADGATRWVETSETIEARAPQHVQEHRLSQVVGSVPGEGLSRERRVARQPGPGFEVGSGSKVDALGAELGAEPTGGVCHDG